MMIKNNLKKKIISAVVLGSVVTSLGITAFASDLNKVQTRGEKGLQKESRMKNNAKENINQDSKGNVTLEGNKYVLNFMGATKIYDGKKSYTISPEDEEVTVSSVNDKDDKAITPAKMLTFFNSGYKYSMDIVQNVKGRKIQFVKLIPNNTKDQRKEILLGIDSQTKNIYNLIEIGKNGTKTTLTVNSFKTNQPISKNQFTFVASKYPNYYINKLD